ncbi:Ninja-family protein 8 [Nymphaea thermarum]|nr:Ninja-family protein 8 [Nymphaea thermarum]
MDDDSGIELSLGLSCGGSAGKFKGKGSCSDLNAEGGKNKSLVGNFDSSGSSMKHFIQTHVDKHGNGGQQRNDPGLCQQENFWTDLGKCSAQESDASTNAHGDSSRFMGFRESWLSSTVSLKGLDRPAGIGEEKIEQHDLGVRLWPGVTAKRKMPFEELENQKKQEKETEFNDAHGKSASGVSLMKNFTVSISAKDNPTSENEDVAESEGEGSTTRAVSSLGRDGMKRFIGIGSDSSNQKDSQGFIDSGIVGSQGSALKQPLSMGSESKVELGNLAYGIPFSRQPLSVVTVPYASSGKTPTSAANASTSGFSCMQLMPPSKNNEGVNVQQISSGSFQLTFGYSPGQLPALEPGSSLGGFLHSPQLSASGNKCLGEGVISAEHVEDQRRSSPGGLPRGSSETSTYEVKLPDLAKNSGKRPLPEMAGMSSSSQGEDITKADNPKDATLPSDLESFLHEMPGIRPGIAAAIKFGGNGSYPDLPWVSTTGSGPNGRTISGAVYKFGKKEIRIVCACHGIHLTPDEFVQHAAADTPNHEGNHGLSSFPSGNQAASAKS